MEENSENTQNNIGGKSIASFILGILGIVAWLIPLFGYPIAIAGIILGCIARKTEKNKLSLAGLILSSITLALTLTNSILGVVLLYSQLY